MVEQRLIHRDIFSSTLFYDLGERFPGKELAAQRMFQVLCFVIADDYGRGKYIPADIRSRGFTSAPSAFGETTLDDINRFMEVIEKNGSAFRYQIKNDTYFFLPKFFEYQPLKYRQKSHIKPPDENILSELGFFLADSGEILPTEEKNQHELEKKQENQAKKKDKKKGKEKKKKEKKKKGIFVYLFDSEIQDLRERFGQDFDIAIEIYDTWKTNYDKRDTILSDYANMKKQWLKKLVDEYQEPDRPGWICDGCEFMGSGEMPGTCPECAGTSFNTGHLPPDWKEKNKAKAVK